MTQILSPTDCYRTGFDAFMQDQIGSGPSWLTALRRSGFASFEAQGFPTRHIEDWRFTPIAPILETRFEPASPHIHHVTASDIARIGFDNPDGCSLVFINGRHEPTLSTPGPLPSGAHVLSLASALRHHADLVEPYFARQTEIEGRPFAALNTAFMADGAVVIVPRGGIVEAPIHLLFITVADDTPSVSYPRTLVIAGENSHVTVVESYTGLGDGVYFTDAVTEIMASENSGVDHYKLNHENPQAFHIASTSIELARNARFSSHSVTLGGRLVRNDFDAGLHGEGIDCTLNGLYLGRKRQLIDNHTSIDHAMPHCQSHELYKGILTDQAHGVFNGKILVRQDAQKTDAKQTNQTLLLSKEAQINTTPQLEIFADDVRCTHGATIGQLSADALFYLRSRGIGSAEARAMLTFAFANDAISGIKIEALRTKLESSLMAQLVLP